MVAWLKAKCDAKAERQAQARLKETKYLKNVSQKEKVLWAAGAFLALLATFFFGLSQPPAPKYYALLTLVSLVLAGATGALIRSLVWGSEENTPSTSLFLGGVAGFVAGLAYLIPQYVGKYGVLDPKASTIEGPDKIQFVSAVLVAISAGIGFDTVFTRLKEKAQDQPVGVDTKKT
jgi:peptidoglycan/LPS O-acetylase OafA/YrhL